MIEGCALSGLDLKIKFRTILLTSIITILSNYYVPGITNTLFLVVFGRGMYYNFWCPCMAIDISVQ